MNDFRLAPAKRPPITRIIFPVIILTVFGLMFAVRFTERDFVLIALLVAIPTLTTLVWFLLQRARLKRGPGQLRLTDTHLIVPKGGGVQEIPFEEIRAVLLRGGSTPRVVIIESAKQDFWIDRTRFDPSQDFDIFVRVLNERVRALPGGQERFNAMAERARVSNETAARPVRVTKTLLIILAAIYAVEYYSGALDTPFELVALGANAPVLVFEHGQWFRLVSGNFLHANLLHIGLNGLAILNLGTAIERMIGPARFMVIYMASAIGGAVVSALFGGGSHSVGASTAVFGLLGAFGLITVWFKNGMPVGLRQSRAWWIQVLGVNAALPLMIPQIDGAAHAGGFIAGIISCALVVSRSARLPLLRSHGFGLAASLAIAVGLCSFGLAGVLARYPQSKDDVAKVLSAHAQKDGSPEMFNLISWKVAIDPAADAEALKRAKIAAKAAVDRSEGKLYAMDTLATIQFRMGEIDDAIALEQDVFHRSQNNAKDDFKQVYASQLARFLKDKRAPDLVAELQGDLVRVTASPKPTPRTVYVVASRQGAPMGLFVVTIAPNEMQGSLQFKVPEGPRPHLWLIKGLMDDLEVRAAMVVKGLKPTGFYPMDTEVSTWPK